MSEASKKWKEDHWFPSINEKISEAISQQAEGEKMDDGFEKLLTTKGAKEQLGNNFSIFDNLTTRWIQMSEKQMFKSTINNKIW